MDIKQSLIPEGGTLQIIFHLKPANLEIKRKHENLSVYDFMAVIIFDQN